MLQVIERRVDRPTWLLANASVTSLQQSGSRGFQPAEFIRGVQYLDPTRSRESLQPLNQRMTFNAGKGSAQACGKIFRHDRRRDSE